MFRWYILRVITGKEQKIKSYIEKELELSKLDQYVKEILIPAEEIYQTRRMKDNKSKKIVVKKSFFPGYMLVHANLEQGEVIHTIVNVPNVINFLSNEHVKGAKPTPIQQAEIDRILGKLENTHQEVQYQETYLVSEAVKIIDGPFENMTGTVKEVFEEKKKLNVMVKIFGRTAPVELNYSQVEKFTPEKEND